MIVSKPSYITVLSPAEFIALAISWRRSRSSICESSLHLFFRAVYSFRGHFLELGIGSEVVITPLYISIVPVFWVLRIHICHHNRDSLWEE